MIARLSLAFFLLCPACFAAEWHNALKPAGEGQTVSLVGNGKSEYAITIPASPTSEENKAASDLQHWIAAMTGATLPISAKASAPAISIATHADAPPEQYAIAVDGKNIALTGGPGRGVINAVYALLEEDLGCRFYTNEDVRLAKSPTLTASIVPRTYAPKLMLRDPFYFASFDAVWSLRNRTNAPDAKVPEEFGGHVDYGGLFVHTAATLLPPARYFKEHPEYFAQDAAGKRYSAQLCPTDPHVAKIVADNVLAILDMHPEAEIISVSKNDSGGDQVCHCERCEKLRAAEGTEMANQLVLVNYVADEVAKTHPKVLVDTLAYLDTIGVPKTVRPHKNVIIRICNDSGAWNTPFTPARELGIASITKQWGAVHDKLSIWDYNVNFSHFLAPMPNMDVIADNIRFWVENHAVGVMTQGGYQSTSERDELRSWVIAKLMWDPRLDVHALVEDFTLGHYGSAGPLMMEYEALLAQTARDHAAELAHPNSGIRFPMTLGYLSKGFLADATGIFAKAEKAARDDQAVSRRVERAELPIMYVQLMQGDLSRERIDRFETIARREKVDWLSEGSTRLDAQLAAWRKQLPPPATVPAAKADASVEPIVISKGREAHTYQAFPDACRLKNGDIVAVFYAGYTHVSLAADDFPLGGRICIVRSSDEGKTWTAPAVLFDDADDNRDPHIAQLDDGTVICTFFSWRDKNNQRLKSYKDFTWKHFDDVKANTGVEMVTSHDNGKTWDIKARSLFPKWVCSAPIRQLPDGTCVLGLYGASPETHLNIGGSARSTDRGMTWEAPVAIQSPPGVSLDAETDIIRLTDGRLYAALRSSKQNMHFAISDDEAKSWSPARDIGFQGHCPHLNRLSTGEIILSHRVPQTSIHISRDDAKTWQGPYAIDSCNGAYPATVELKDRTVLIVYYTEGAGSVIRARRFKLKPDGIEFLPL